ncbi:MAG: bifunctional aspartate kinase/homoserine dehydrogenase I, partial [Woeseiaceae bacterium]
MAQNRWKIHKFGGSSLADADCFQRVAAILANQPDARIAAVVSAMAGMTDKLLRLAVLAEQDDDGFTAELHAIGEQYASTARELVKGEAL